MVRNNKCSLPSPHDHARSLKIWHNKTTNDKVSKIDYSEGLMSLNKEDFWNIRTELNSKSAEKSNKSFSNFICWKSTFKRSFVSSVRKFEETEWNKIKIPTFESIRHSLNRYLQSQLFNKTFDIVKDEKCMDVIFNFRAVMADLNSKGKRSVDHHQ